MKKQDSFGIYVHIPFCARKCNYCAFYSIPGIAKKQGEYIKAVEREIDRVKGRVDGRIVDTIYFGGGTPSFIGVSGIEVVINKIRKEFRISKKM